MAMEILLIVFVLTGNYKIFILYHIIRIYYISFDKNILYHFELLRKSM